MLHTRLFKLASNKKDIQVWEIHTDVDRFWTVSGKQGGKMTERGETKCPPKAGRSQEEQLALQVNRKIEDKKTGKYVENINDIHKAEESLPAYSAMLAHKYDDHSKKIILPAMIQPKLDGLRCLTLADGFFSRRRKPFSSCQHIWEELEDFFKRNPEAKLDGELYSHEWKHDFETISSAVKKTAEKATPDDIKKQLKVKYYVYDAPVISGLNDSHAFKDRYDKLKKQFKDYKHVVVVETHIIESLDEVDQWHDFWESKGYEGAIIRNMKAPYEGKRSYNLQKYKKFDDDEFEIVGVKEKKDGTCCLICKMPDSDETFDPPLNGSHDRAKWVMKNPHEVIGKMATIKYFGYTNESGVPRFPQAKAIRGLKDRSDWV